jgi:asparagine synthase (glutamine-hydrolysing)
VAVAHLDGDWYESTLTCLECIVPYLAPGGCLVIDDYDHWSGCRKAIDEFFADRQGFVQERRERLHIVKQ